MSRRKREAKDRFLAARAPADRGKKLWAVSRFAVDGQLLGGTLGSTGKNA
jgi:hypothetical protein